MLVLQGVEVRLQRLSILRGVSMEVPTGSIVGLVGRNGAGKTTTLRSVMGLVRVASGTIEVDGIDLRHTPAHHRPRLGIGYVPEDRRLVPSLTVEQNLLLPAQALRQDRMREQLTWIYEQIPEVKHFARRRANQLSGGQQKLVAVARALMVGRRLLLLDEPFEGLAPTLAERVAEVITAVQAEEPDIAVVIADSEYHRVEDLAQRVYHIERGRTA
ncbi:MAG: ABC transporter ATP-binding protein [Thermoleophilia bacterium]